LAGAYFRCALAPMPKRDRTQSRGEC
jgi:hypothetical protein